MGFFDVMVRAGLPLVPRRALWVIARRYVAGDELDDALRAVAAFRSAGYGTILDVLGENVRDVSGAEAAAAEYERALERLPSVDPGTVVSVKPTHLGLMLDRDLCERLLSRLCVAAAAQGRRVRFEMEDSPTVQATLDVFEKLLPRHPNLGCVLQSRLFRTAEDVERLCVHGQRLNVRLVKGIYIEPAKIAWTEPADIRASYVRLARRLLDAGAFVGLATHDAAMVAEIAPTLAKFGGAPESPASQRYELQCLMGVQAPLAEAWRRAGHPVRIYVPYGRDWHAYSMRRLTRNPEIARAVLRAVFGRDRQRVEGVVSPSG